MRKKAGRDGLSPQVRKGMFLNENMQIPGVNRSEDGGGDGKGYEPFRKPAPAREEGPRAREEGDTAQLTSPERAALQLMKELVVQRYRTLLGNPPPHGGFHSPDLPLPENPEAWATSILRDLNLLFGPARADRGEEEAHGLMVQAFQEGTEETLEILRDLGAGSSPETWERIAQAGRALFRKLAPFLGKEGGAEMPSFLEDGPPVGTPG